MTIVADASVAVRWIITASGSDRARDLLLAQDRILAPDLVIVEIANALWKAVVFDGLPAKPLAEALTAAQKAFDELVPSAELKDLALSIALELRHPVYDCFYLALAQQRDCEVATFDARLLRRCANTVHADRLRPV